MSRVGNFSSSEIYKLMSKGRGAWSIENVGASFKTYVKEKRWERKLRRSLKGEINAKATSWGTLVEEQCFNVLDLKYSLVSKDRFRHDELSDYWTGMPDLLTDDLVGDIKSPYTLNGFMELVDCMDSVENFKATKPQYYWQLVSNGILCKKDKAIIVAYVPYQKDLEDIRELARTKIDDANKYAFINWAEDNELPYLPNDCDINDVQTFEFEIPQEDKDLLTERVKLAVKELEKK